MRYYNKTEHNEIHLLKDDVITGNLIPYDDISVAPFFDPIPDGQMVIYVDDMPVYQDIPPYVEQPKTQATLDRENEEYLASTDYLVIKQVETGEPVPDHITEKRADARAAIVGETYLN